ncbi:hypothetical protein C8Q80DRAFT_1168663 [Daedaleopsis nitida]|nr:hypothetical protein C8Q80DRAFT_1168663 [Daedaleopsis nitida]
MAIQSLLLLSAQIVSLASACSAEFAWHAHTSPGSASAYLPSRLTTSMWCQKLRFLVSATTLPWLLARTFLFEKCAPERSVLRGSRRCNVLHLHWNRRRVVRQGR